MAWLNSCEFVVLMSIPGPCQRPAFAEKHICLPANQRLGSFVTCEHPRPQPAPGVREETILRYKVNGSADMTEYALVRASQWCQPLWCEPAHEHGPGIVGDSGERSDAHPVCEIESNSTFPIALPFVDHLGADDGSAQA